MSEPTTKRKVRITVHAPDHYADYTAPLSDEESARQLKISNDLAIAEISFSGISDYTATQVRALMPSLVTKHKVKSIEFIHYRKWMRSDNEFGTLNGVILRGKHDTVVLFVYGVSLSGSEPGYLADYVFETFEVSAEDREEIKRKAWPYIDYSVFIELL